MQSFRNLCVFAAIALTSGSALARESTALVELDYEISGPGIEQLYVRLAPDGRITHDWSRAMASKVRRCRIDKAAMSAVAERAFELVGALPTSVNAGESIRLDGPSKTMRVRWGGKTVYSIWYEPDAERPTAKERQFADAWQVLEELLRCP